MTCSEIQQHIKDCPQCNQEEKDRAYWKPCLGCKEGHPSFWATIIKSKEWEQWEKEISRRMHNKKKSKIYTGCWDTDECRGCGHFSPEHWKEFIEFLVNKYKD